MHIAQPTAFALAIASLASCSLITDFDSGFPGEDLGGSAGRVGGVAGGSGAGAERSNGGNPVATRATDTAGTTFQSPENTTPPGTAGSGGLIGGSGSGSGVAGRFASGGVQEGSTTWSAGGIAAAGAPTTVANGGIAGANGTDPARVSVALGDTIARVPIGQSGTIDISILRQGQGVGDVEVSIQGLPAGVAALPITIATGANSGQLSLQVAPTAAVGGPYSCTIAAASKSSPSITNQVAITLYLADQAGRRDKSFGSSVDGGMTHNPGSTYGSIANLVVDAQGRTTMCGSRQDNLSVENGWLARLAPNGALDMNFGAAGLYTDFGTPPTMAYQVGLNDGKLYLSANNDVLPYLRRIPDDSSFDPTFGVGGDVAADGLKPLIAFRDGIAGRTIATSQLHVYSENGTRDNAFPEIGIDTLTVDPLNRIVVAQSSISTVTFRRILATGAVDSGFGVLGETELYPGSACTSGLQASGYISNIYSVHDGSIRALFHCYVSSQYQYVVLALDTAGKLDTQFGTSGFATIATSPREFVDAFTQADGKLVILLGEKDATKTPVEVSYVLTRIGTTGLVDSTFGSAGTWRLSEYLYSPSPFGMPCASGTRSFCAAAMAYDKTANRALIAGWIEGLGFGAMRFWL